MVSWTPGNFFSWFTRERSGYESHRKFVGLSCCCLNKSRNDHGLPFHARDANVADELFALLNCEWQKLMRNETYIEILIEIFSIKRPSLFLLGSCHQTNLLQLCKLSRPVPARSEISVFLCRRWMLETRTGLETLDYQPKTTLLYSKSYWQRILPPSAPHLRSIMA